MAGRSPVLENATSLHVTVTAKQMGELRSLAAVTRRSHSELVREALETLFSGQQKKEPLARKAEGK